VLREGNLHRAAKSYASGEQWRRSTISGPGTDREKTVEVTPRRRHDAAAGRRLTSQRTTGPSVVRPSPQEGDLRDMEFRPLLTSRLSAPLIRLPPSEAPRPAPPRILGRGLLSRAACLELREPSPSQGNDHESCDAGSQDPIRWGTNIQPLRRPLTPWTHQRNHPLLIHAMTPPSLVALHVHLQRTRRTASLFVPQFLAPGTAHTLQRARLNSRASPAPLRCPSRA
jgi:hypothetical protein